jgi:tetratricopeptide (TPR) repeat protein
MASSRKKQSAAASSVHAVFAEALQHHQSGRLAEAEGGYQRILTMRPRHADSLHLLGVVAFQTGRFGQAVEIIRRAIASDANIAAYHSNLGLALVALGQAENALASYHCALKLQPDYPEALCNLGAALARLGRREEAIAAYERSLARKPDQAETHYNLGTELAQQGRLTEAVVRYRQAIQLKPDYLEALNNLGITLVDLGQVEEALVCYQKAMYLRPEHPNAYNNCGAALAEQGRLNQAVGCYRQALARAPAMAEAHYNLARAMLANGDMPAGWAEFEWRWKTQQLRHADRQFKQPQWRGEAGLGRTLLIHAEQGFGDTLQFCRFAGLAAERGFRIILEVPQPLVRLMRSLVGVDVVVARGENLPEFDLHCPIMSLPMALGTKLHSIPATMPYLLADPRQVAVWRQGLAPTGAEARRMGVVWAGNPRRDNPALAAIDRRRSLDPELLAPLFHVDGWCFFSLQKAGPAAPAAFPLIDHMGQMADFADTAALIMQLDLVVAVDTAVAHLAAALGKPVWLLNRFDTCWRWMTDRRDSPWYPELRLYRQPRPGDWESVVAEAARDLRNNNW